MRELILEVLQRYPGLHFRAIARELDTSTALIRYHLDHLQEAGEVDSQEVGGYVRYFLVGEFEELTDEEREKLNVLRQEKPLEIVLALLHNGSMQHKDLHQIVPGSKGSLSYHLRKLQDAGLVRKIPRGESRGFHLEDEDEARQLVARCRPESDMLDDIHDMWEDLFGGQ